MGGGSGPEIHRNNYCMAVEEEEDDLDKSVKIGHCRKKGGKMKVSKIDDQRYVPGFFVFKSCPKMVIS